MPTTAIQISFSPGTLPEGSCFTNEQARLNAFAEHLSGNVALNITTINFGPTTPSADARSSPWHRKNVDGSPSTPGMWDWYNGAWRQLHPMVPGLICLWKGDAALVDTLDGGAAGAVTVNSGPFWAIDTAFAARFPCGVGTFPVAGAVAVAGTGGSERVTLETKHLPEVLGRYGPDMTKAIGLKTGSAGTSFNAGGAWQHLDLADFLKGGTTDTDKSHENLPPFIATYFIVRTQRIFRS